MNLKFKQWLQEQEYAWNPRPRKKGWIIWKVNRNILLNSELEHIKQIKWEWDGVMSVGGPGRKNK